jgi:hypothetical protein
VPATLTASQPVESGVDFGIDGRSVRVSQEAYSIFLAREAAGREKVAALQQRLTAADERADLLDTALRKIKARLDAYAEADMDMPNPSVEVCQMIADAALKPAEGQLNQCDGCQAGIPVVNGAHRMGKPGAYPDTMSCTAKLYKP